MKIFISYSRSDEKSAIQIEQLLKNLDVEYFLDSIDIQWGDIIRDSIESNLSNCDALVVLLSPNSLTSEWVHYEIGLAKGLGLIVLPYMITPECNLPAYMAGVLYLSNLEDIRDFIEYKCATNSSSIRHYSKLEELKIEAIKGDINCMFEYGMLINEISEKKRYLKQAADKGHIIAIREYAKLL